MKRRPIVGSAAASFAAPLIQAGALPFTS